MLIELDESIINESNIDCLRHASVAMQEGKHVIYVKERYLIDKIIEISNKLNENQIKSNFFCLKSKFAEINSLKKIIKKRLIIIDGKSIPDNTDEINYVSNNIAQNSVFWNNTSIVLENIDDYDYYQFIYQNRINKIHPEVVKINLSKEVECGGGGDIGKNLKNKNQNLHISIAILDSDKRFPKADYGTTAKKVLELKNDNTIIWSISEYKIIEIHELENLFISESFLKFVAQKDEKWIKKINWLNESKKIKNDIDLYFDLKSPYTKHMICHNDYFNEAFKKSLDCLTTCEYCCCFICSHASKEELLTGFGSFIKKKDNKKYINDNIEEISKEVHTKILEQWDVITQFLLDWCCGYKIGTIKVK